MLTGKPISTTVAHTIPPTRMVTGSKILGNLAIKVWIPDIDSYDHTEVTAHVRRKTSAGPIHSRVA